MPMNLLMSDTAVPQGLPSDPENRYIDLSRKRIGNCRGCFGCWVKTPGKCVIRDDAPEVYPLIAESERIIYVSRIYLGSFDAPMKAMLERALPIQQAFIRLLDGETHHFQRAVREKGAVAIGYLDEPNGFEEDCFERLVGRYARNMCFAKWRVRIAHGADELEAAVREEVAAWGRSSL